MEEALVIAEKREKNEDQRAGDLVRAELMFRLGRIDEAREAATRFLAYQEELVQRLTAAGNQPRMEYFRMAKALEILGRRDEALTQLEKFILSDLFPDPNPDQQVFRDNPAALARLAKVQEKRDLIAKRILEIENSYAAPDSLGKQ